MKPLAFKNYVKKKTHTHISRILPPYFRWLGGDHLQIMFIFVLTYFLVNFVYQLLVKKRAKTFKFHILNQYLDI